RSLPANEARKSVGRTAQERAVSRCCHRGIRTLADQADSWTESAEHISHQRYHGLAESDQQRVAIATELLSVDMLDMKDTLQASFQQQGGEDRLPAERLNLIRECHETMEAITFNQAAATYALSEDRIGDAALQQARSLAGFEHAEELFDRIRRMTIEVLDELEVRNPTVADLRDPTLDEFLRRLEQEPNIEARLGIPARPRNIRRITEMMMNQQSQVGDLGDSGERARQRANRRMRQKLQAEGKGREKPENREMTDEEQRQQAAMARDMQEMLEEALKSVQEQMKDPKMSAEEKSKLERMAQNMQRMLEESGNSGNPSEAWEKMVQSEQTRAAMKALAAGQLIPDEQWNKLQSSLDNGLWQVGGRTPPEDHRKAIEQYQDTIRRVLNLADSELE
ncbi:MAG: hypothetical protein ABGZ24_28430, partial [Fuerstiella sp.]